MKTTANTLRAQSGPPRPSSTSGAFAAVRASVPTPAPAPVVPPSPPPPPASALPIAAAPEPQPEEHDVTIDDEDLGATIPDQSHNFAEIMAAASAQAAAAGSSPIAAFMPAVRPAIAVVKAAPAAALAPLPTPAAAALAALAAPDALPAPMATAAAAPMPLRAPVFGLPAFEPSVVIAQPAAPASAAPPAAAAEADSGPPSYGPGAIIDDKYRLIRVVGRGGMGAVWVAHNTALDVEVAVKLMRRDRATPEATARFTTEARAAARLGHPGIVRVFDFGETSRGDPFIVMELLHGESLGALLGRKKKLSPNVTVQTLLPVAHALAAAHAKGIVHRDLKPDNILLARDESGVVSPKLVDFGIAKLLSNDVERHFTIAGEVLGSPDYMSPEQARGEDDIDHRTDVWTFSVLLYEAVSGKRPFDGSNYNALLAAIIASRPAPIMDLGIAEPGLWAILEKGLAKEREGRWQSMREYGTELARWAIERGIEHDLAGASLGAQWLEPTRRRLFTVAGSTPPEADPVNPTEPQIPKPPPLGALVPVEAPKPAAPATATTMPPFVPRRRPWITLVVLVVCASLIVLGLIEGGFFQPRSQPAAPSLEPGPAAAPTASITSEMPAAPSPTTSVKPATSARPRATTAPTAPRPKAPQVKGNIKF